MSNGILEENKDQLQVIGAGFGRTGTNSLKLALNALGYKTYHMFELLNENDQEIWIKQVKLPENERNLTDMVYKKGGYNAAVDFPTSA